MVQSYRQQTYVNKELIVVDNGDDETEQLIPFESDITYLKVSNKRTTGEMRNLCNELSRGELICNFDSDDWSAPTRVAEQVDLLHTQHSTLTGYRSMLFFDEMKKETYRYAHYQKVFVLGTSFCYQKSWWKTHPFKHVLIGEDQLFFSEMSRIDKRRISTADARKLMVARIHEHQTCKKKTMTPMYTKVSNDELPRDFWHAL